MSAKTGSSVQGAGKTRFECSACGWSSLRWVGRCGGCQEWSTITEVAAPGKGLGKAAPKRSSSGPTQLAQPITEVSSNPKARATTGVPEFDRVLGGGLVPGAVILLAGEPGAGKSTLLLDVASKLADGPSLAQAVDGTTPPAGGTKASKVRGTSSVVRGRKAPARDGGLPSDAAGLAAKRPVLYVTGEESADQVGLRARRIGALSPGLLLAATTDLDEVLALVEHHNPAALIVDSVQTIASAAITGVAGNTSQIREVAAGVIGVAKSRGMPCVMVGHVTKDGSVAGPRVLEHLVDVVCQFEGDRYSRLRMIRAVKNRYGPTDELGCFSLEDDGICGVADPSSLFRSLTEPTAGSVSCITVEGRRPLAIEIQALISEPGNGSPRRTTHGVDSSRVAMIVAVLSTRLGLPISGKDIFVSTVGGVRVTEPAADLAIALALCSASSGKVIPATVAACGEVSLSSEIRPVTGVPRRISEAERLGFEQVLVPTAEHPPGLVVPNLAAAAAAVHLQ